MSDPQEEGIYCEESSNVHYSRGIDHDLGDITAFDTYQIGEMRQR